MSEKRILIVDDNPTNVFLFRKILEKNNYNVTTVISGKDAIEKLDNQFFDLILLDILMPQVDGFQVLEFIRNKKKSDVKVIIVSACNDDETINRAMSLGATEYITKPILKDELLKQVKTLLESNNEIKDVKTTRQAKGISWFEKYFPSSLRHSIHSKKTVLIVDDTLSDVILLEHILEENNYRVISVRDGLSAVEMIENQIPDLVIMDVIIPEIDGFEVLRRMRHNSSTKDIPVIMVSLIKDKTYIQKAQEMNVSAYVTKPYKSTDLAKLADRTIEDKNNGKKNFKLVSFI